MLASLETRWLRGPRHIPLPNVALVPFPHPDVDYAGCYWTPHKEVVVIAGVAHDCCHGLIALADAPWQNPAILAHEYRHHVQTHLLPNSRLDFIEFDYSMDFQSAVVKYFTTSNVEKDALLYEHAKFPTAQNEKWLEWIGHKEPKRSRKWITLPTERTLHEHTECARY